MHFPRGSGVVQSAHPVLLDQKEVVRAQAVGDAHGIQRPCIVRIPAEARLLQIQGSMDLVLETLLGPRRWIQLCAAQQGVVAGDELAFERAIAVHLPKYDRLGGVIVQVGVVGIFRNGLIEIGEGLIEFQVVKVIVARVNKSVSGVKTHGEQNGCDKNGFQYGERSQSHPQFTLLNASSQPIEYGGKQRMRCNKRQRGMGRSGIVALMVALLAALVLWGTTPSDYQAVVRKFSLIEHDRLKPGSRVVLTPAE